MSDYISREAAKKAVSFDKLAMNRICGIPAADVVERANANEAEFWKDQYICASEDQEQKHGIWLGANFHTVECSECGFDIDIMKIDANTLTHLYHCPNCGADMRQTFGNDSDNCQKSKDGEA